MEVGSKNVKVAAAALVEAAVRGLQTIQSKWEPMKVADDLRCRQCESLLFEPTTLEDGVTVCQPCVRKYRDSLQGRQAGDVSDLPAWASSPEEFGFGKGVNVVMMELTKRCCPAAHAAAAARQRANALFGEGKFAEAATAYTDAISGSPFADIVLHCNRSAARLKLGDSKGAVEDAELAVALSARSAAGPGGPMWTKAWFRLGHALLSSEQRAAEALFALAMSTAALPTKPPAQLMEATARVAKSEIENIRSWLNQATCPTIDSQLPSLETHSLGSFQLGLDADKTENLGWVREQLECALCLGLLWEPSTIPCGHTVCRPCLARTLDHAFDTKPTCPMCRTDLSSFLGWINARAVGAGLSAGIHEGHGSAQIRVNTKIDSILLRHFPAETEERKNQIEREEAAADGTTEGSIVVPIFICSMAMPSVACPLHIFEPRYRLMMRRCIESGQRQFGMCLFPEADFGTMLRILDFNQLPDGRSQIKTIGTRRFQVLRWGVKDGYATGHIKWIDDTDEEATKVTDVDEDMGDNGRVSEENVKKATDENVEKPAVALGVSALRSIVDKLLAHVSAEQLEHALGPRPDSTGKDGPNCPGFVFWCASLSQMPPERAYGLCFGDECRHSSAKRLDVVLAHFQTKFAAMQGSAENDSNEDTME